MSDTQDKVYIGILTDTLEKKLAVLEELKSQTIAQSRLLLAESFDEEKFNGCMAKKDELLGSLASLDKGFDEIYTHVSEVIDKSRYLYREQIEKLQQLIRKITDMSVELQTLEEQNKNKLQLVLGSGKKRIKDFKVSSKTAAAYYKNMSSRHQEGQSYFMDKKK